MHDPKRSAGTDPLSVSRILHMTGASPDRVSLWKLKGNTLYASPYRSLQHDVQFRCTRARSRYPFFLFFILLLLFRRREARESLRIVERPDGIRLENFDRNLMKY